MPMYCYRCGKSVVERHFPIGEAPRVIQVGRQQYKRSYQHEGASVPATKGWPMECIASGVSAGQAGQLRQYLERKGVPTEVSADGNPIYLNAKHRKKALKARGIVDRSSYI